MTAWPLDNLDVLQMWRIDEDLHLHARPIDDVPHHKGRVHPAPPDARHNPGKRQWRVVEGQGDHCSWPNALRAFSGEVGLDKFSFFGRREEFGKVGHKTRALEKALSLLRRRSRYWRCQSDFRERISGGRG